MWVPVLGHPVGGANRDQAPLLQPRDAQRWPKVAQLGWVTVPPQGE